MSDPSPSVKYDSTNNLNPSDQSSRLESQETSGSRLWLQDIDFFPVDSNQTSQVGSANSLWRCWSPFAESNDNVTEQLNNAASSIALLQRQHPNSCGSVEKIILNDDFLTPDIPYCSLSPSNQSGNFSFNNIFDETVELQNIQKIDSNYNTGTTNSSSVTPTKEFESLDMPQLASSSKDESPRDSNSVCTSYTRARRGRKPKIRLSRSLPNLKYFLFCTESC
jgi:hypothetical protein